MTRPRGQFVFDGVGLEQLMGQHQTPLYVYSASSIRSQYNRLKQAFPGFDVCYSFKANPNPRICRLLSQLGAGAEISSLGELETALDARIGPDDIIFVGPAKTEPAIRLAVERGIYALVADSVLELGQIETAAWSAGRTQRGLLRINTLERPSVREAMVGGPSKFGFDEETVVQELRGLRFEKLRIAGVQVYSASQVLDAGFLSSHFEYVLELALRLAGELDFDLECIDFGGGFGVTYSEEDKPLELELVAETANRLVAGQERQLRGCRLLLESGRFIVAESGVFLTTVLRVKKSRGKTFVITDGGMNHFSRPIIMRVQHPIRILNRLGQKPTGEFEVCGPICTPIDCIGTAVRLPEPQPGDILGVFMAGAYGYTMSALDFMSLGRPTELLADNGQLTVMRKAVPAR